jgi:hypothetical protein
LPLERFGVGAKIARFGKGLFDLYLWNEVVKLLIHDRDSPPPSAIAQSFLMAIQFVTRCHTPRRMKSDKMQKEKSLARYDVSQVREESVRENAFRL